MAKWKEVKSIKGYMANIIKDIESDSNLILLSIAEDIRNILYIYTQNWYDSYSPEVYERTYEFINSLTVRKAKGISNTVEIGFDMTKLSLGNNNGFMQHEDRFTPLSSIIDSGWVIEPSGRYRTGSKAIKRTIDYMEGDGFRNEVEKEFLKYGYKAKF